ncbi:head-tail connector protein [Polaromonas sp.]|uniref:head-tail connector protein n=1 Tax=Polaromonas sp. TaxID=1869339 RepID=UPI0037533DBE
MQFKVVTTVAAEPVTLAEARLQCKIDADDTTHDALITSLITAAREFAEHYTGRALAGQTLEGALDSFPDCDYIDLPMPPVVSVTSIKYTDTAGAEQTLSTGAYALSAYGLGNRVNLAANGEWPSTQEVADAVRVRFVAGYTTAPKAVKAAILLHIEIECPLNPHTPAERDMLEKARDSLLNTVKVWGM